MNTVADTARITNLSPEELEKFFLLLPRIYSDPGCKRYGLAYIYANTKDNEDSSFLRAIELADAGQIEALGISEGDRGHGYEGFDHSVERLKALGWKGQVQIIPFNLNGNVNTGSEATMLVGSLEHVVLHEPHAVIAPPFHIVRAFMTTVTALKRYKLPLRVYAVPGIPLRWNEQAAHSQGTLKNTRAGLMRSELERLEKYRAPQFGSMLSAGEVIEYLNWRDGINT